MSREAMTFAVKYERLRSSAHSKRLSFVTFPVFQDEEVQDIAGTISP